MPPPLLKFAAPAGVILLGLASVAAAHGHDGEMNMDMSEPGPSQPANLAASDVAAPATYFQYGEHSGLLAAHIVLMTIGWVFVLPIGE